MTTLVSPGVSVSVVDESFYDSTGPGTVPLIVFATATNKASPTGSGIAPGTVPSQAGALYLATSQRELIQTFGNPIFKSVQGTPVHGYELNEYGLHAAYQYLGIANRAYVMRADVDLGQLEASVDAPRGEPVDGTVWFDLTDSQFGVFQNIGNGTLDPFAKQPVVLAYQSDQMDPNTGKPMATLGSDGDFAVVTAEATNRIYERISGTWYLVGSTSWKSVRNVILGSANATTLTVGNSFSINGITIVIANTGLAQTVNDINTAIAGAPSLTGQVVAALNGNRIQFNFTLDSLVLANVSGTPLADLALTATTYNSAQLFYGPANKVPTPSITGDVWIKTNPVNGGAQYVVKQYSASTATFATLAAPFYQDDTTAASALGSNPAVGTLYVQYNPEGTSSAPLAGQTIKRWNGSAWAQLAYEEDVVAPTTDPEEGTLWFDSTFKVDVMVCDGEQWLGYRKMYPSTDPNGVILSSVQPLAHTDTTALVDNDLWLDTSDLENYPKLYRYNATTKRWTLIDNTDQTTPYGIVFADARQDSGGDYTGRSTGYSMNSTAMADLTLSNYVDPDAPDPLVYSAGTILFNTRFSTNNVKKWMPTWFALGGYDANADFTQETYTVGAGYAVVNGVSTPVVFQPVGTAGRWVTASGNKVDGSPYMGRKAQRQMVVEAISAVVAGNQDLRSELVHFNLIACPGYTELIDEMITLNTDQKETAFIVADTPARLDPSGTSISNWATNAANAPSNGDLGLTSSDPYVGVYYPWGLSTNIDGSEIMVPPSTIALRTIAYNDNVAYPWFAPAGFTRGLVTNASSVGYLTDEGEYQPVILNQGQRDTLYQNKINPIAYIPNRGLVVYGQKTLNPVDSALDRVNVARLINYMRYNLDNLAKPFLFEQNDNQTRDAFKVTIERFLMGLVGLRALDDFAVVCDTTNNTADRINRNELWADIVIQPTKSVEFIYLPIRIRNSGDSLDL